jgi:murein DD-endopeptidase MepM/ murein hydrolase activator NlpD
MKIRLMIIIILIIIIKNETIKEKKTCWPIDKEETKKEIKISQVFGPTIENEKEIFHTGIDIVVNNKTNIYSISNGFVRSIRKSFSKYEILIFHKGISNKIYKNLKVINLFHKKN